MEEENKTNEFPTNSPTETEASIERNRRNYNNKESIIKNEKFLLALILEVSEKRHGETKLHSCQRESHQYIQSLNSQ